MPASYGGAGAAIDAETVTSDGLDGILGSEAAGTILAADGAGSWTDAGSVASAARTAMQVPHVRAYTLADFTGVAGSESAPTPQGSGVYRFSVSAVQRYLGGVYTYDGVTYTRQYTAPHMTLTPPAGTHHIDARVRIAGHSGATVWEMVSLLLRGGDGAVLLHGLSTFAVGTSGDIRGGDHTTAYPAGGAPSTERLWTSGTSWLRVVWADGELIVYTGTGSGTAEPTAWERHSSTYVPAGQVGEVPTVVIGAPRVTSSSNSTAGASGTFSAWTVDLQANVYVRAR